MIIFLIIFKFSNLYFKMIKKTFILKYKQNKN